MNGGFVVQADASHPRLEEGDRNSKIVSDGELEGFTPTQIFGVGTDYALVVWMLSKEYHIRGVVKVRSVPLIKKLLNGQTRKYDMEKFDESLPDSLVMIYIHATPAWRKTYERGGDDLQWSREQLKLHDDGRNLPGWKEDVPQHLRKENGVIQWVDAK